MTKKSNKTFLVIFWIVLVGSFLFSASTLVLIANGYHLNAKNFTIQKTGMIVLDGFPSGSRITINNIDERTGFPVRYGNLFPGSYEIKIVREKYQPWVKVYDIDGGQAAVEENIMLFLEKDKIIINPMDSAKIEQIKKLALDQGKLITKVNDELWFENKLVTRFSGKIETAVYDRSSQRFYVQVGNNIKVLDKDGTNVQTLIDLQKVGATSFYVDGRSIFYIDSDLPYSAQIR